MKFYDMFRGFKQMCHKEEICAAPCWYGALCV